MKRPIEIPFLKYLNLIEINYHREKSYEQYFAPSTILFTVDYSKRVKQCFGQFIPNYHFSPKIT